MDVADERYLDRVLRAQDEIDRLFDVVHDAAPAGAEGTDSTGSVRVVLGPDGTAERIDLEPGWRRTIGVEALAPAVMRAAESAADARAAAQSAQLAETGFQQRLDTLTDWVEGAATRPPPGVPDRPREPAWPRDPRPHDVISRQMLAVIDEVEGMSTSDSRPAGRGVGTAGFGRLTVHLSHGLRCTADPEWLSRRTDDEIAEALSTALAAARADAEPDAGAPALSAEMSALSVEMVASLRLRADLA